MNNKLKVKDQECVNCRFFYYGEYGVCRRKPPVWTAYDSMTDKPISEFPPVDENDWCGEWKEIDED